MICNLLNKFGPLTIDQIVELVECENSTYRYGPNSALFSQLQKSIINLMSENYELAYSPFDGRFSLTRERKEKSLVIGLENFSRAAAADMKFEKLGRGSKFVYVMYSKSARYEAILKGSEIWPLKVGRTNNPLTRCIQLSESGPNLLTIAFVIRSDNPKLLEKRIHAKLTDDGRLIEMPHRKEWFLSNLNQVKAIYNNLQRQELI